tara:strand:- start:85 stop:564 length:480 start_codon:yes stop_codon:yes gene_type:complete
MSREDKQFALEDQYESLLGHTWKGRRLFGCYEIIRKFYKFEYDRELIDFNARKVYSFTDEAIAEEGGGWIYRCEWGDADIDFNILEKGDIMLFRIYTNSLEGGYSAPQGRAPNHGAVYLGDRFMLHHPYNGLSEIVDLTERGMQVYKTACVGAIRGNSI